MLKKLLLLLLVSGSFLNSGGFNFSSETSTISLTGANSKMTLEKEIDNFTGKLKVKDNVADTISSSSASNNIVFDGGVLQTGSVVKKVSGTFDATGTDKITLNDTDYLDVSSGTVSQTVEVAAGATATILGQPKFSSAIALGDASSVLQVNISSALNQSVTGSGKLYLLDDLTLESGVALPSLVELQAKTLHITGGTYSTATSITTNGKIELKSQTEITQVWSLGTGADEITISGHGNKLTLSGSGAIDFDGTTLILSDVHVKGISGSNLSGTGNIKLINSTLELSGNYTRADGDFTIEGDNSKVITNGSTFTIDGSGNAITVDGVILFYEQLDGSGTSPFVEANSGAIVKNNSGDIRHFGDVSLPCLFDFASQSLTDNCDISAGTTLTFNNDTPATPKPMSLDGDGHKIIFSDKASTFILDGNVQATISNTFIQNFNPSTISYGDSNATLTFSDDVQLRLDQDLTIESGDKAWTFDGDATIDGLGHTLTVNKAQGITITNAKTLTLQNMRLVVSEVDALKCLSITSNIKLFNVDLVLKDNGFNFDAGDLEIAGYSSVLGSKADGSRADFTFSSSGDLTILTDSVFFLDKGIKFTYSCSGKEQLLFSEINSELFLNGCAFDTGTNGLHLFEGTITVQDTVTVTTDAGAGNEFEIQNNCLINILNSGNFKVDGNFIYKTVTPVVPGAGNLLFRNVLYDLYLQRLGGTGIEPSVIPVSQVPDPTLNTDLHWRIQETFPADNYSIFTAAGGHIIHGLGGSPRVSTPSPPYLGIAFYVQGSLYNRVELISNPSATTFNSGDLVYITTNTSYTPRRYLATSNIQIIPNVDHETYSYNDGSGNPPSDGSGVWEIIVF